jgi:hypothetical protein
MTHIGIGTPLAFTSTPLTLRARLPSSLNRPAHQPSSLRLTASDYSGGRNIIWAVRKAPNAPTLAFSCLTGSPGRGQSETPQRPEREEPRLGNPSR